MTDVLIKRELLEHMRNFTVMHDSGVAGVLRGQIDAVLAQPAQQGDVAQVVSYLSACADGYDPDAPHPGPPEPLMTVAQHQRILADMRQQRAKLARLLRDARELIDHGDFREDHCMCGSSVDGHGIGDGHSPVDAGEYYAGQLRERIDAALSELTQ